MINKKMRDTRVGFRFPKNTSLSVVKKALKDSKGYCDEIIKHKENYILLCYDYIDKGFYYSCKKLLLGYKKTPVVINLEYYLKGITKVSIDKEDQK